MSNEEFIDTDSIFEFVNKISADYKNDVAFEIRKRVIREKIYYRELVNYIKLTFSFLHKNNVKVGDRVLIWGFNCPEYSISLLSMFSFGIIAVPVDYRTSKELLVKIINQTNPKAALVSRFLSSEFISEKIPDLFYLEDLFEKLQNIKGDNSYKYIKTKDHLCEIVFTSGTTGVPKGVMISQKNILLNSIGLRERLPKLNSYRTISILPLSHMYEQIAGLFVSLSYGAKITYLTTVNSYKLKKAMAEYKPTYLLFVPQMLRIFWERIEEQAKEKNRLNILKKSLQFAGFLPRFLRKVIFMPIHKQFGGHLEFIAFGGAPLDYTVANNFKIMGLNILEGYGATEITAAATYNHNFKELGHVGKPLKGVEIKLDENNQILIKSSCLSRGYYKNEEMTKKVFINGWYRTGDIGKFDKNNNLIILGRDYFKIVLSSGEKVYVEDLEQRINEHPAIKESCVIGLTQDDGDKIHAVLIIKKDFTNISPKRIIAEINGKLESKQQIMSYSTWPINDFPRTPTLKIERGSIKKIIEESLRTGRDIEIKSQASAPVTDLLSILSKISNIPRNKISFKDSLTSDLGFDSLDRGELIANLEEYLGISIDVVNINSKTTVYELQTIIDKTHKSADSVSFSTWQFSKLGEFIRIIFLRLLMFPLHAFFVHLKIKGKQNIKFLKPKTIIIFNHPGVLDGVCILRLLGNHAHKVITPAYANIVKSKPLGLAVELGAGALPLDQSASSLIPLLQYISDLIDDGRILLYAPQGRIQNQPVEDPFKIGIGYFAHELNLPVVPVKLIGYEKIWAPPEKEVLKMKLKELFPKKIGDVVVKVGKPIYPLKSTSPIEMANLIEEQFNKL